MTFILTLAFIAMVIGSVLIGIADGDPIDRLDDDNDF